ncbi:hypothetical protein RhiLY_12811 [Ceratobasidium sp. AG-Ba]|nr:hypothetical protein RhiLY_12811 [Ceratobasidium sp. AG-Ba]
MPTERADSSCVSGGAADWMLNEDRQTPCQVAESIVRVCTPTAQVQHLPVAARCSTLGSSNTCCGVPSVPDGQDEPADDDVRCVAGKLQQAIDRDVRDRASVFGHWPLTFSSPIFHHRCLKTLYPMTAYHPSSTAPTLPSTSHAGPTSSPPT